jgi:hypothetical protein
MCGIICGRTHNHEYGWWQFLADIARGSSEPMAAEVGSWHATTNFG